MTASFYADLHLHADAPALVSEAGVVSYRALEAMAQAVTDRIGPARSLVFLEARNEPQSIAAYLGCLRGGHPVYLFGPQDELRAQELAARYRANLVLRTSDGVVTEDWLSRDPLDLHPDLRILLSTSGSTGSPKFVKLSHRNVQSNAAAIAEYLELSAGERAATSLAFNYSYGMSVVNSHLAVGASLLLTDRSVAEPAFWSLFREHQATSFAGVPYSFEILRRGAQPWADIPSLRYATQAGGRLAPELVRDFAELGAAKGWKFVVMYGQTEAAPRIAYLPWDEALTHPDAIGVAIPGGELSLQDAAGAPITGAGQEGELVYRGPNVMMGYALTAEELATDATPDRLLTGDIALRTESGLFRIVGRTSRIVKPYGVRINLDEMQEQLRAFLPGAACAGDDDRIVVAVPQPTDGLDLSGVAARLGATYGLPAFLFQVHAVEAVPMLGNGKVDVQALLALKPAGEAAAAAPRSGMARLIAAATRAIKGEAPPPTEWSSVREMFEALLEARPVLDDSTFIDLAGDSLSYVQAHLGLEAYLGEAPEDWAQMTVAELEAVRAGELPRTASDARIRITPAEPALIAGVKALNQRLELGGSTWRFYDTVEPDWLAPAPEAAAWRQYFLAAVEDAVRGGYVLKQQPFRLDGHELLIGNTQGPVSEGIVDPRFGFLGAMMIQDALRRQPLQLGWGPSARKAELLVQAGWPYRKAPILLHVTDSQALLRRSRALRGRVAPLADLAAATGLGRLGIGVLQGAHATTDDLSWSDEPEFGSWADEVWAVARDQYRLTAVRDARALNTVMPAGLWPHATPLKVMAEGQVVGWAAIRDRQLADDPLFGDLRVGSIVDALSKPGHEADVAAAATGRLREAGVHMIGTAFAHRSWISAFRGRGYLPIPGRRTVTFSPGLAEAGHGFATLMAQTHLALIDGDGPHIF